MQQIAVLASLTSVPPGLRANDSAFVKTSFQNMALHPSTRPISVSPPVSGLGLSHDSGSNGLKSNGFDSDPQDSFFADISSLSSSLMAKDSSSSDAGDSRSLPMTLLSSKIKNASQKLSSSSYDALLLGNMGAEASGTLLSSHSQGDFQRAMGADSTQPLRILKHPTVANSGLTAAESMGGAGGEDSEEAATLLAAQQERAQFPPEFIDKLVAVLKRYGSDGLLGSQFPEAYKKLHGEKLVLENKKG